MMQTEIPFPTACPFSPSHSRRRPRPAPSTSSSSTSCSSTDSSSSSSHSLAPPLSSTELKRRAVAMGTTTRALRALRRRGYEPVRRLQSAIHGSVVLVKDLRTGKKAAVKVGSMPPGQVRLTPTNTAGAVGCSSRSSTGRSSSSSSSHSSDEIAGTTPGSAASRRLRKKIQEDFLGELNILQFLQLLSQLSIFVLPGSCRSCD